MTASELGIIMRALGKLEAKVDTVLAEHETLHADVEVLKDAAKLAAGITSNRRKAYLRLGMILAGLASMSTAGTALVSYVSSTTRPDPKPAQIIVVKQPACSGPTCPSP